MIRTTPFHERLGPLNETGLWEHWSGFLAATKYQMAEKFEYFAIRNSAGLFDSSPLYKYRIGGVDAERYLSGVLARDIRTCRPGRAQYTLWCDDAGYVVEDGVAFRYAPDEFLLTSAEPNLAYLRGLAGRDDVRIEEVSDDFGVLAFQGPRSRDILASLAPAAATLGYFEHVPAKIGKARIRISRTGYTGDLGFELWVRPDDAIAVWDALVAAGAGQGVIPFGLQALTMARIEAGLLLLDVDFESSRFAWNDDHRSTPGELGLDWMLRGIEDAGRPFIGRKAILGERAGKTSRWKLMGLVLDWADYERRYNAAGLIAPKDHNPVQEELFVYDPDGRQVGYSTSFMYSPMLQRHIALARVRPDLATPGTRLALEWAVSHRYEYIAAEVARLPLYNPARKTA